MLIHDSLGSRIRSWADQGTLLRTKYLKVG